MLDYPSPDNTIIRGRDNTSRHPCHLSNNGFIPRDISLLEACCVRRPDQNSHDLWTTWYFHVSPLLLSSHTEEILNERLLVFDYSKREYTYWHNMDCLIQLEQPNDSCLNCIELIWFYLFVNYNVWKWRIMKYDQLKINSDCAYNCNKWYRDVKIKCFYKIQSWQFRIWTLTYNANIKSSTNCYPPKLIFLTTAL